MPQCISVISALQVPKCPSGLSALSTQVPEVLFKHTSASSAFEVPNCLKQGLPYWEDRGSLPHKPKICSSSPTEKIPLSKFPIPPSLVGDTSQSLDAIWKTLSRVLKCSKQLKCPSSVSSALKNLMAQKMNDISQFLASLLAGFKGVGVTENFAGGGIFLSRGESLRSDIDYSNLFRS